MEASFPANSPKGTTLLVIVGCLKDSDETPFIIGAFNEEYLNQVPIEDADDYIGKLKQTWTMDEAEYDWRELRVWVADDHIDGLFDTPMVIAEVLGDEG